MRHSFIEALLPQPANRLSPLLSPASISHQTPTHRPTLQGISAILPFNQTTGYRQSNRSPFLRMMKIFSYNSMQTTARPDIAIVYCVIYGEGGYRSVCGC